MESALVSDQTNFAKLHFLGRAFFRWALVPEVGRIVIPRVIGTSLNCSPVFGQCIRALVVAILRIKRQPFFFLLLGDFRRILFLREIRLDG